MRGARGGWQLPGAVAGYLEVVYRLVSWGGLLGLRGLSWGGAWDSLGVPWGG